jgi:hypothetical protein
MIVERCGKSGSCLTMAVHLQCHARLGQGQSHRLALYRAGKAHAEWLHREFQWAGCAMSRSTKPGSSIAMTPAPEIANWVARPQHPASLTPAAQLVEAVLHKIEVLLTDKSIQFADLPENRYGATATFRGHRFDRVRRDFNRGRDGYLGAGTSLLNGRVIYHRLLRRASKPFGVRTDDVVIKGDLRRIEVERDSSRGGLGVKTKMFRLLVRGAISVIQRQ